jgi:hypothetical protein
VELTEACARWSRLRFAIDATPYPRPDAECSPERGHVHHAACRGAPLVILDAGYSAAALTAPWPGSPCTC